MDRKRIAIIGSTGSIGTQTLDIIGRRPDLYAIDMLAAGSNARLLAEQARKFNPAIVVIADESRLSELKELLADMPQVEVQAGAEALADAMERPTFDTVVTATVGFSGLAPTIRALCAGKDIALANKETLVVAGELIMPLVARICDDNLSASSSRLYPVDSEHSALWQCLRGEDPTSVRSLILTASGGPFLRLPADEFESVTVERALANPNWEMGAKITIDSATMVNKAFEVIEARWLYDISAEKIRVMVHPQSIVHSMVEYVDGAVKAQLGVPDMRLPIAYALGGGERLEGAEEPLSITRMANLTFEEPDTERFPALTLAWTALREGGNAACVINAANEVANLAFRKGRIPFTAIYPTIMETLGRTTRLPSIDLPSIFSSHDEATRIASEIIDN